MFHFNNRLLAGFAAAAIAATVLPAGAQEAVTSSRVVHVAGLDLASPADQTVLRHKLMQAAARVCEDYGTRQGFTAEYAACYKAAFDSAWARAATLMAEAKSRSLLAAAHEPSWTQRRSQMASAAAIAAVPQH